MKKLLMILLISLLFLTACNKQSNEEPNENPNTENPGESEIVQGIETAIREQDWDELNTESDLEAIIMGLYTKTNLDSEFLESVSNFHLITSLKKEDIQSQESYFGDNYNFKEAKISESGISTSAYSLMLIRAENPNEAQILANSIKDSVNPNKWVCVTAETVVSSSQKDLVLVIMGEQEAANEIIETFKTLK